MSAESPLSAEPLEGTTSAETANDAAAQDLREKLADVGTEPRWQEKMAALVSISLRAALPQRQQAPWILRRTPLALTLLATCTLLAAVMPPIATRISPHFLPSRFDKTQWKNNLEAMAIACDIMAAVFLGSSVFASEISRAVGDWAENAQAQLWRRAELAADAAAGEVHEWVNSLPVPLRGRVTLAARALWAWGLIVWIYTIVFRRSEHLARHYARSWLVFSIAVILDHMPKKSVGAVSFFLFFGGRACKVVKLWVDMS